ncbi:MAG: SRPBCC family protein [Balneolaceae bacterium]|nr:SRPBCC family protein [Balneolaceae bacterium]
MRRTINAPVDRVFSTVSDVRIFAEAIPDIVDIEFLTDSGPGEGTRFRETREINGNASAPSSKWPVTAKTDTSDL